MFTFFSRHLRYTISLVILVLLLSGCTSQPLSSTGSEATTKKLTLLFNVQSNTIDPHTDVNYTASRTGISETLVKVDDQQQLQPWLATSWESKDGQHWTFQIRPDITFHSGTPVDAQAVKASLQRVIQQNPAIRNALHIEKMTAKGQTLQIVTDTPLPQFPSELVHPNTGIIDTAVDANTPSGTGPFILSQFKPGIEVNVKRNPTYWDGQVKLDEATFSFNEDANARLLALQSGNADVVYRFPVESLSQLQNDPNLVIESVPGLRAHQLIYNMDNTHLVKLPVRQAIDSLLNRQEIVDAVMSGQASVAKGPFLTDSPFSPSYTDKPFDIERARTLFAQAGYTVTNGQVTDNGAPLTFKLVTYQSRAELPLIAQLLQANAAQLGIKLDIQQVDNADEYLAENKDWDMTIYSFITAPRGDASYLLNSVYTPTGGLNYGQVKDAKLNTLIQQLNQTVDADQRNRIAQQAVEMIDRQLLHSYIIHPNNFVAHQQRVTGWVTSKSEYYMLTKDLDVN
ncbi:nickel ABC transporter substrate-binding protein [Paenibacillus nicotianae]|uniref:Nickel ABC transporter substrate-binding protein n=1 Tax=Paenibacillus nicotianae TaxID=1526551 RepID=A0ABW4UT46_9BACL